VTQDEYSDSEILSRPILSDGEVILRALYLPSWDPKLGRGTPSAFTSARTSVNRLAIYRRGRILRILRHKIEPQGHKIEALVEFPVSVLRACGAPTNKSVGTWLWAVDACERGDASHGEVLGTDSGRMGLRRVSKGIANKILNACETLPTRWWRWYFLSPLKRLIRPIGQS
jgi:hypothetical protein